MNDRDQWLELRRTGIGGSDAPAALGLSKWTTPLELYRDKRGELPAKEENEPMKWGTLLEPVIRQQYAERTGRHVMQPQQMIRHPQHAFMLANVDGIADGGRLVEIKTARSDAEWGEPGTDEVPQAYLIQVQHYLSVTALPVADVAVLFGGSDFRIYEVPADHELQQMIIEGEADFWRKVEAGTPPDPVTLDDVVLRYGRASKGGAVQSDADVREAVYALWRTRDAMKILESQEDDAKAIIFKALGEADTLMHGNDIMLTWKLSKPSARIDAKALQTAHPEIYKQFLTTGAPSRRLLLK